MSDTPKGAYEVLADELKKIANIKFTEYEWATRPTGNHGTYKLDFHADGDRGDDLHQDQAWEGSVRMWTNGQCGLIAAAVESALETVCEGSWELSDMYVDESVKMLFREFTFQLEAI